MDVLIPEERRNIFLKDTAALEKRRSIADQAFLENSHQRFNTEHLKMLLKLIDRSNRKGVHLIFLMPPRLQRYEELLALKEELPSENVVEVANPNKYPMLYQVKYSFDVGHLNTKGAQFFSIYLARELEAIRN